MITQRQFIVLTAMFVTGSSILILPAGLAVAAHQDAWIAALLGVLLGAVPMAVYGFIAQSFPRHTLPEIAEMAFGRWLGSAAAFLFFIFALLLSSLVVRNMGDFMITVILPETPVEFMNTMMVAIITMGVALGLQTMGRAVEVFFVWSTILFFLFMVIVSGKADLTHMQPILEADAKSIFKAALVMLSTPFIEMSVLLLAVPGIRGPRSRLLLFAKGAGLGSISLIVTTLLCISVLGPQLTSQNLYPTFILAKQMNIGKVLERMEAMVAVIWFFTLYVKATLAFYAASETLTFILRLKERRTLLMPLGILVVVLATLVHPNTVQSQVHTQQSLPYKLTLGMLVPLLIAGVARLRRHASRARREGGDEPCGA